MYIPYYYVHVYTIDVYVHVHCTFCIFTLSDSLIRTVTESELYTLYPECRKKACCSIKLVGHNSHVHCTCTSIIILILHLCVCVSVRAGEVNGSRSTRNKN